MVLGFECFRLWERHRHSQSSMLLRDLLRKMCFRIQALAVSLTVLDLSPSRGQNFGVISSLRRYVCDSVSREGLHESSCQHLLILSPGAQPWRTDTVTTAAIHTDLGGSIRRSI